MTPELLELIKLQGEIKTHLVQMGMEQALARAAAAEAIDKFLKSKIARRKYQLAYVALERESEEEEKNYTMVADPSDKWFSDASPLARALSASGILVAIGEGGGVTAWECPSCRLMNERYGLIGVTCENCVFSISFPELEEK